MAPLLSIIAINYNTAEHTIEMVNSVKQSTYPNLQVIVVDNCSADEDYQQLEVLRDSAVVIRLEENIGFSGGNNVGLRYALDNGAEYAMLLNNDTTIEPDAIAAMVDCVRSGEADAVCPKILCYYDHSKIGYAGGELVGYKGAVRMYGFRKQDGEAFSQKRPITFASGCCVLMHMQTWQQIGFMSGEYFLYFEDTDMSAKLVRAGKKILYLPKAVVYHKESISTHKLSDNYQYYFCRNRLLYIKKNIPLLLKPVAYAYTGMYMLKHLVLGRFSMQNIRAAVHDYTHSRFGKRPL